MYILNIKTLESLLSWMTLGDQKELLEAYLLHLPKDFEQLQHEILQGDLQSIKRQAHRIKGAYGNIGCEALCHEMQLLETSPETIKGDLILQASIAEQFQTTQYALSARLVMVATSLKKSYSAVR